MSLVTKCSRIDEIAVWLVVVVVFAVASTSSAFTDQFEALDDSIFFISWPGPVSDLLSLQKTSSNPASSIVMTTVNDEKYKCILPSSDYPDEENSHEYQGPSALELISPLFTKFSCIVRFENYWVYELCHGRHLKQYHEEKESGETEVKQEYYLGKYDMIDFKPHELKQRGLQKNKVLHRNVEGIIMPYVTINMTDGTRCDLSRKPRTANVHYACHPSLKQEIYSIEETLTCEYDVLVLTNLLCEHPDYRPKSPITNEIHCHALDGTRQRPLVLHNLETESLILNPSSPLHTIKMQFDSLKEKMANNLNEVQENSEPSSPSLSQDKQQDSIHASTNAEKKVIQEFLEGRHCLHGGSGWWKYEFCYGKKVEQYHEDAGHRKTVVVLGKWDEKSHLQWLEKNPHKKPKYGERRHVSHFYGDGDFCIEAAFSRRVEVKLRCKDSKDHPNAVSLYLLEPRMCEYILVVESPILCALLPSADENGFFRDI